MQKDLFETEKQKSNIDKPVVSGCLTLEQEFENLWNGKERKPRYYDGDKNYDNSAEVRKAFEILWGK